MIRFTICISILLIVQSCNKISRETEPTELFNQKVDLAGHHIDISDYVLGKPFQMIVIDSLVVSLNDNDANFLHILDIKNKTFLGSFCRQGNGPNEFMTPFTINQTNNRRFAIYDINLKSLFEFNIDSLIKKGEGYQPSLVVNFSKSNNYGHLQVLTIDDKIFSTGTFAGGRYAISSLDGKLLRTKFDFPRDRYYDKLSDEMKAFVYQGKLRLKPDHTRFVFTSINGSILEICKIVSGDIEKVRNLHSMYPIYNEQGATSRKSKKGYVDVCVTDKYIYTLYSGHKLLDYHRDGKKGKYILIFDWDGDPIINIELDRYLSFFTVDKNNGIIYGVSELPEPRLFYYKIHEVLLHNNIK